MAYFSTPVKIPKVPGKITYRKKADATYVLYETERTYNAERQNTNPQRKIIGQQIRNAPTLMLPNENYERYFEGGAEKMTAKERETARSYASTRSEFRTLQMLFDHLYYEFLKQSHKHPDQVVSKYKIQVINQVLEPLLGLMAERPYACFLVILDEPTVAKDPEGNEILTGLDYGDVALALTQYKGAITRFSGDLVMMILGEGQGSSPQKKFT